MQYPQCQIPDPLEDVIPARATSGTGSIKSGLCTAPSTTNLRYRAHRLEIETNTKFFQNPGGMQDYIGLAFLANRDV